MTMEEKAYNYAIDNVCSNCNNCQSKGYIECDIFRFAKKAYMDSAKENGIQWHDLREDPNDLPLSNDNRLCSELEAVNVAVISNYCINTYGTWWNRRTKKFESLDLDIIAWSEVPTFGD